MTSTVRNDLLFRLVRVIGGEEAVKIFEYLSKHDEITDDELAVEVGIRPNEVRKILYKFVDSSLVSVKRFRDEKTGWYLFKWRLQPDQVEGFIQNEKRRVMEKLRQRLDYERNHNFYYCLNKDCPKVTFEEAMETTFLCPKCRKPLEYVDNDANIAALEKKISVLEHELSNT